MLSSGTFLQNRYEIISRIGSGGMADVYKAKDHKLNRYVAVKVLKSEFKDDKAFLSKFRVEAQAAAGLSHANIVNVYDVGEDHGANFIVMELVEGITLKNYIAKKGKLSVREATSIMLQVAAGIEAAHNNGIIHRDIKPQNILISMDGKAKVADFGIARAAGSNTISSTAMGSVHYCSPEQARGGYSDAKSDIYSMGITMFEMLTGRVPFDGDSTVEIALKHLQEDIPSPRKFTPEIPFSTEQIVLKCTQKSPDRRYQNVGELIRDLKESLVNPNGNFVVIPAVDRGAQTVMLSKEEVSRIKNESLPSYDNSLDTGAAGISYDYPSSGSPYQSGSYSGNYYQSSGTQSTGRERFSSHSARNYGSSARQGGEYAYRSGTGNADEMNLDDDSLHGFYEDEDDTDADLSADRRRRSRFAGRNNTSLLSPERAAVLISILAAIVIAAGAVIFVIRAVSSRRSTASSTDGSLLQASSALSTESTAVVPSILGLTEAQAQQQLGASGLGYSYQGESPSTDYAKGLVVSQSVDEGSTVDPGTVVGYVLSSGSGQTLTVPALENDSQADAENALRSMGLQVVVDTSRYSNTISEGSVITTNPGAGSSVSEGDTVTIYISQGSDSSQVEVPEVEGHYENDAITMLSNYGLYAYITRTASDTVDRGIVISQDIAAGTMVSTGSAVTLTVSSGSENAAQDAQDGTWRCNAQLNAPENYNGEPVRIVLVQGDVQTTIYEGTTSFPYVLNVEGIPGVSTGTVYIYTLDPDTWAVTGTTVYEGVAFERTDEE